MEFILKDIPLPARLRLPQPINEEDLLHLCAANGDLRFERDPNGEVLVMAPVGAVTGATELEIGAQLLAWAKADGRGKVFGPSTGFTLPDQSVRMPDAAWVSFDRWNALTDDQQRRFSQVCPEFVIEVRSESDRLSIVQAKMMTWIANGAEVAWLVDPQRHEVTIYRKGQPSETHYDPSSVLGTGPVEGFELIMD